MSHGLRSLSIVLLLSWAAATSAGEEPLPSVWEQAQARGVVLRAVGNEPGWLLEIDDDDRALLLTDYGAWRRTFTVFVNGDADGMEFTATVDDKPLHATFTPASCSDTMSDRTYPLRVTVTLGDQAFNGCGVDLR